MSDLARFQDAFAAAMVSGDASALRGMVASEAELERFAVYRNNFVSAATAALTKNYPALERLVGPDFLAGAARAYVAAHPPRRRALTLYGEALAAFLADFPPAHGLAYLPDVAALDRAYLEALFSAEAPALAAETLAELPPDAIAGLAPGLHPSARVVRSEHPAYAIWRTCREDAEPKPVDLRAGPQAALIWRPEAAVRHRALSQGEAAFLSAVGEGASFAVAAQAGMAAASGFDLMTTLAGALAAGAFADLPR